MKVTVTNTKVKPVYWAHLRPWPYGVAVEVDLNHVELAHIKRDTRLDVKENAPPISIDDAANQAFVADGIVEDVEKRGPGRPKKGK